jgi:hypothetical protein
VPRADYLQRGQQLGGRLGRPGSLAGAMAGLIADSYKLQNSDYGAHPLTNDDSGIRHAES